MTMIRLCPKCRAELSPTAQFCRICGAPSPQLLQYKAKEIIGDRRADSRATWAIAIIFAGTLVGLIISTTLPLASGYSWGRLAFSVALDLGFGLGAAWLLRGRVAIDCLLLPSRGKDFFLAILLAAISFSFSIAYVGVINRFASGGAGSEVIPAHSRLVFVVLVVIQAPLIEEWLCRGIMWQAMRQVAGPTLTILSTAMLFAFLHILGGGGFLELPHRFVAGIAFGILRWKTNSLWPSIFAHFLNNLAAVILMFS